MRGEKGQFYLIAAVVIIMVIIGFVAISNYGKKENHVKIYDLEEELSLESENIIDYGTYKELGEENTRALLLGFVEEYSNYLGEDIEIYFLIGNSESIIVVTEGDLIGGVDVSFTGEVLKEFEKKTFTPQAGEKGEGIKVKIKGDEYRFKLKEGENFYFIISYRVGDQRYVTTN